MRAKEFTLNESIIDNVKSIYNTLIKDKNIATKITQIQQNKSLINSITQSLITDYKSGTLTKDRVIEIVKSKLPAMEDSTPKYDWKKSKFAGWLFLLASAVMYSVQFFVDKGPDGYIQPDSTGEAIIGAGALTLMLSLVIVIIDIAMAGSAKVQANTPMSGQTWMQWLEWILSRVKNVQNSLEEENDAIQDSATSSEDEKIKSMTKLTKSLNLNTRFYNKWTEVMQDPTITSLKEKLIIGINLEKTLYDELRKLGVNPAYFPKEIDITQIKGL
jgi:uncharacterized membrane protein YcjF (UPF0283 family)